MGGGDGASAAVIGPPEDGSQSEQSGNHPDQTHHGGRDPRGHPGLVSHGMYDIEITFDTNHSYSKNRGRYEKGIEKHIKPAFEHRKHHAGEKGRAADDPQRHEQGSTQQVHDAQVTHQTKLAKMGSFYDDGEHSAVCQQRYGIKGHHDDEDRRVS